MINLHDNYWEPSPGYKYITNGEAYSTGIYIGRVDSIENWHDTNDEPPDPQGEATSEDYENALIQLGVSV